MPVRTAETVHLTHRGFTSDSPEVSKSQDCTDSLHFVCMHLFSLYFFCFLFLCYRGLPHSKAGAFWSSQRSTPYHKFSSCFLESQGVSRETAERSRPKCLRMMVQQIILEWTNVSSTLAQDKANKNP